MVEEKQDSLKEILEFISYRVKITSDFYCDFQIGKFDDSVNGTNILNYHSRIIFSLGKSLTLKIVCVNRIFQF